MMRYLPIPVSFCIPAYKFSFLDLILQSMADTKIGIMVKEKV